MVQVTVTIPNAHAPEVLAAVEKIWRRSAINLLFAGVEATYDALTPGQKLTALGRTMFIQPTQNERRRIAEQAIALGAPVDVT